MEAIVPVVPQRKRKAMWLCAAAATATIATIVMMLDEEEEEELQSGKVRSHLLPYMKNIALFNEIGSPEQPLVKRVNVVELLSDPNRNYAQIFTALYGWEFITLADYLRPYIEVARNDSRLKMGNRIKFDHYHRFYFIMYWLSTGSEYRMIEALYGWGKTCVQIEIKHMLKAIIKGLDSFVEWPSIAERQIMSNCCMGIFKICIGIMDASEHPIQRSKNKNFEKSTYSGICFHHLLFFSSILREIFM